MFRKLLERFRTRNSPKRLRKEAAGLEAKARRFSNGPDTFARRNIMPISARAHDKRLALLKRAEALEKKIGKRT